MHRLKDNALFNSNLGSSAYSIGRDSNFTVTGPRSGPPAMAVNQLEIEFDQAVMAALLKGSNHVVEAVFTG